MLAYAFDELNKKDYQILGTEPFKNHADLCAELISISVTSLLRRGLGRDYIVYSEPLSILRGRIDISESIQTRSLFKRRLVCVYDEFSVNSYMNCIIKTAILWLLRKGVNVEEKRKKRLRDLLFFFNEAEELDVSTINWRLQYNRNNKIYELIIFFCGLVLRDLLQKQGDGSAYLEDYFGQKQLFRLYEKFILNYYAKEYRDQGITARSPRIKWVLDDEDDTKLLPSMQSDIVLSKGNKILIIDAKFYYSILLSNIGGQKIRSAHLYQIFTYVKNKAYESADYDVSGMLLYAKTDEQILPDESYNMSGNSIAVKTLDLNCNFLEIKKQLEAIAEKYFGSLVVQG
ncbi:MAG: 5-methylcytosine-specific restriction endonuclease system specificity protein McrC [Abditibacteriota bacterium]|nr:5-methylcytosine-specific restriction endonuclease system specificity protein McrC [Abditibacteriota bacterium]